MIQLFKVQQGQIDLPKNLLHDYRKEAEEKIADYVGAKYAVGVSSCTDAIFLALKAINMPPQKKCSVPALITTRFLGAILDAGYDYYFTNNPEWVGHDYKLLHWENTRIIDSAHRVDPGQFGEYDDNDLMLISNYPTKPLGGLKGGFVISNDEEKIEWIRQASLFGEDFSKNSWESQTKFVGWQKYMNAVEAIMVLRALEGYKEKRERLFQIREMYDEGFKKLGIPILTNTSYHLYRVAVKSNKEEIELAKRHWNRFVCGIHYEIILEDAVYGRKRDIDYTESEIASTKALSIPYHDGLTDEEVQDIIRFFRIK